jgi:hypothetical protein
VTRSLLVECSAARCQAQGIALFHGIEARSLPPGWQLVSTDYDKTGGLEFCSLQCVATWALAMDRAHKSQRAWQAKKVLKADVA